MNTKNPIVVVLALPTTVPGVIERANGIHDGMAAATTWFPSPTPALVTFASHIADLVTSQTGAKTHAAGAVALRDEKLAIVVADCHQLKAYVQQVAIANPTQAATIAQAASMRLRVVGSHNKSDLAAKQKGTGVVEIAAKVQAGEHAHEWQWSADGKTWTSAAPSLQGKTTLTGLPTGVTVYFRHRATTKAGPGDWSQPISLLVS